MTSNKMVGGESGFKVCTHCKGKKSVLGLGCMIETCPTCEGLGYVQIISQVDVEAQEKVREANFDGLKAEMLGNADSGARALVAHYDEVPIVYAHGGNERSIGEKADNFDSFQVDKSPQPPISVREFRRATGQPYNPMEYSELRLRAIVQEEFARRDKEYEKAQQAQINHQRACLDELMRSTETIPNKFHLDFEVPEQWRAHYRGLMHYIEESLCEEMQLREGFIPGVDIPAQESSVILEFIEKKLTDFCDTVLFVKTKDVPVVKKNRKAPFSLGEVRVDSHAPIVGVLKGKRGRPSKKNK